MLKDEVRGGWRLLGFEFFPKKEETGFQKVVRIFLSLLQLGGAMVVLAALPNLFISGLNITTISLALITVLAGLFFVSTGQDGKNHLGKQRRNLL